MVSTGRGRGPEAMYEAMQVVVEQGLRNDASAFDPERSVWTLANFENLKIAFTDGENLEGAPFLEQVDHHLAARTPWNVSRLAGTSAALQAMSYASHLSQLPFAPRIFLPFRSGPGWARRWRAG